MNRIVNKIVLSLTLLPLLACSSDDNDIKEVITVPPKKNVPEQVIKVFSHPGVLFNYEDMARIREQASYKGAPWKLGFEKLQEKANSNYTVKGPYVDVERTEGVNSTAANALSSDSQMAYTCAVMWFITNNRAYADKSIEIINSWSNTLQSLSGGDDMLMAAWYGFSLVNAAEILRYTDSGWKEEDIIRAEGMFRSVFYELIKDWKRGRAGNWDTAITKMHLATAIFLDDKAMFDRAIDFYNATADTENSNGILAVNIYETGQNFESGRDQTHAQMGIGGLAESCEVAWKQGVDLYSKMSNRLLRGFEYSAKYNLGNDDVPYQSNVYGSKISATDRGQFQPIYEMVYNHYFNRMGLTNGEVQYTKQVVDKVRSQGGENGSSIHLGLGSLLYNDVQTSN